MNFGAVPATLMTFAAAVLLGLVTISTPVWNSIYFLKATIGGRGVEAGQTATLGVLGYCIGYQCSSPTIGYKFDPNQLLGITIISSRYSSAVIKGLTYTLILHPIALGLAAAAVLMGLLALCRPMSRNCLGTCLSSLAAVVAAIAFGLDLALFIIAKKRINSVSGASAELGTAIWMTFAAWVLLFLSGFAFCCGGGGGGRRRNRVKDEYAGGYGQRPGKGGPKDQYAEQMRMQALQAENDRLRRQNETDQKNGRTTGDLPRFAEYETEYEVPLKRDYDDGACDTPASQHNNVQYLNTGVGAGAAAAVPGVGAGYGRREPSAMAAYASPPKNNAAGHGAHSIRSGSNFGASSAMPEPMHHHQSTMFGNVAPGQAADDDRYPPGVGPQPYRDGVDGSLHPMVASPTSEQSGTYAYKSVGPTSGARRQPTGEYGYSTDYSGSTFGGAAAMGVGHGGHGGVHQYSSYEPQQQQQTSSYPQRQASESGSRLRSPPRTLPSIPPVSPTDQLLHQSSEIPYGGPGSDAASPVRRQATLDDGFGLTATATTLAAGTGQQQQQQRQEGTRNDAYVSDDGHGGGSYNDYASSAYDQHDPQQQQQQQQQQHQRMPTRYEDVHEGSTSHYQHHGEQQASFYEGHSTTGPPGYDSAMGGYTHSHPTGQYPAEKR